MMRFVFGLGCSGFGVEIWRIWWVGRGELLKRDEGSRARKGLERKGGK